VSADVEERVAKGAALLDEREPGWDARIDLGRLALTDCGDCVLGQLDSQRAIRGEAAAETAGRGPYWTALAALGLTELDAAAHGFDSSKLGEADLLDAEWRRVIEARRAAA
jgi:hypothetical protein